MNKSSEDLDCSQVSIVAPKDWDCANLGADNARKVRMSDTRTADQRLSDLETIVRTLIVFNTNAISTLGRRVSEGNPEIASVIAAELAELKSHNYTNIDKGLHDNYVDNLIAGITGKA